MKFTFIPNLEHTDTEPQDGFYFKSLSPSDKTNRGLYFAGSPINPDPMELDLWSYYNGNSINRESLTKSCLNKVWETSKIGPTRWKLSPDTILSVDPIRLQKLGSDLSSWESINYDSESEGSDHDIPNQVMNQVETAVHTAPIIDLSSVLKSVRDSYLDLYNKEMHYQEIPTGSALGSYCIISHYQTGVDNYFNWVKVKVRFQKVGSEDPYSGTCVSNISKFSSSNDFSVFSKVGNFPIDIHFDITNYLTDERSIVAKPLYDSSQIQNLIITNVTLFKNGTNL